MGYDLVGRLEEVQEDSLVVREYGFDANSNRTHVNASLVATYDSQDRLLSYRGATYSYTDNGELLSKSDASGSTSYNYDVFGNLLSVVLPSGDTIEYLVDGQDRRVAKKLNGVVQYQLLYQDQLNPIAQIDASGTLVARFVYGSRANVPEYLIKAGVTYRLLSDHLGSVRLVVDASTGAVAQRIDYDEFGQVLNDTAPGFQPFGFAGGLYDPQTKLVRFGARDYDPETARWTAKDPILFRGGDTNLYRYVTSDPVNSLDLDGLEVVNDSDYTVKVRPENGGFGFTIPPRSRAPISPDAVENPKTKRWKKYRGKDWLPDNDVYIDPKGNSRCVSGPCSVLPESEGDQVDKAFCNPQEGWRPAPNVTPLRK